MATTHDHSIDCAAGYLRLALPLMARNGVPATPENYAVWYTHVSGGCEPLSEIIDGHLAADEKVDAALTADLYHRFVAPWDEERIEDARSRIDGLVAGLAGEVATTDGDVSRYQQTLAEYGERLAAPVDGEELRGMVGSLAEETGTVRASGDRLRLRLDESLHEVETLRSELERAREEASTDALTGLVNRKGLDLAFAALDESLEYCLLMVDIDRLKRVNDSYGHLIGDRVIRFVADTLRQGIKGQDLATRFGGEEFAILLPATPFSGAMAVAENLRCKVQAGRLVRTDTKEKIGTVTISIGVSRWRTGEPVEAWLGRADEALYAAKEAGRNRVFAESSVATGTHG